MRAIILTLLTLSGAPQDVPAPTRPAPIAETDRRQAAVIGAVAKPGTYSIERSDTVASLIKRAGGIQTSRTYWLLVARLIDASTTTCLASTETTIELDDTVIVSVVRPTNVKPCRQSSVKVD